MHRCYLLGLATYSIFFSLPLYENKPKICSGVSEDILLYPEKINSTKPRCRQRENLVLTETSVNTFRELYIYCAIYVKCHFKTERVTIPSYSYHAIL